MKHISPLLFLFLLSSWFSGYGIDKNRNALTYTTKNQLSVLGPTVGVHPGDTTVIINAFAVDTINNKIYIAGKFRSYNGAVRKNLARIDLKTGAVESTWQPVCSGEVSDILYHNNGIYIAGNLDTIAGIPNRYVARVDTAGNFVWVWGNNRPYNGSPIWDQYNSSNSVANDSLCKPNLPNIGRYKLKMFENTKLSVFNLMLDSAQYFLSSQRFHYIRQTGCTSFDVNNGTPGFLGSTCQECQNLAYNLSSIIPAFHENPIISIDPVGRRRARDLRVEKIIKSKDSKYFILVRDYFNVFNGGNGQPTFACLTNFQTYPGPMFFDSTARVIGAEIHYPTAIATTWVNGFIFASKNFSVNTMPNMIGIRAGARTPSNDITFLTNQGYLYRTKNYAAAPVDPITLGPSAYTNSTFITYSVARDKRNNHVYFGGSNHGFKSINSAALFYSQVLEPSLGYLELDSTYVPLANDSLSLFDGGQMYGIRSCEPKDLFIFQNKLVNISSWHPDQTKRIDYINTYCLYTEKPKTKNITLIPATYPALPTWEVCANSPNKLVLEKRQYITETQYSYTGTGITIFGNTVGNGDSVSVNAALNATPGILKIVQKSDCGKWSDTLRLNITFKPIPNLTVGANQFYTCATNTTVLNATTTVSSYNFAWTNPSGVFFSSQLSGLMLSQSIHGTGNYTATVTDNASGCSNYMAVSVGMDTIKPTLTFPATNDYTLTCKKLTVNLDVNGTSALDSVKWAGQPYYVSTSSQAFSLPGKYYAQCYSNTNGCIGKDSVTIGLVTVPPSYSFTPAFTSITCLRDSFLLQTTSTNTNVIVYWKSLAIGPFATDSLFGNIYADSAIAYNATIMDTVSGCKTLHTFIVKDSTLKPFAVLPSHTAIISCSSPTISLSGSSPTPGTSLQWAGPAGYSSSNPANVSVPGTYSFVVTDGSNGCKKTDTVKVTKQNTLLLHSKNDTTICKGSSITIFSQAIGGAPPYMSSWSSGDLGASIIISPSVTVNYVVTVIDANGCTGKDTVVVSIPPMITDSTVTLQPCDPNNPNGQIQVYPKGGIQPYTFSLNSSPFQSSNVFSNLPFGIYNFTIKDAIGCTKNGAAQISALSMAPQNDFLVSTSIYKVDTFVVVDISNPKPDSVLWTFPATFTVINNSNPYSPVVVCSDTGYYTISQTAYFGGCQPVLTKQVHIKYSDGSYATPYNNNGIQSISLSPNPNTGQFNLNVSMYKKQTFMIFVIDASGVEKLRIPVSDSDTYSGNILVPQVTNGTYILKVVSSYDARHVVFVVSQ